MALRRIYHILSILFPGNVEAEFRRIKQTIFSQTGWSSYLALMPFIPLGFLNAPLEKKKLDTIRKQPVGPIHFEESKNQNTDISFTPEENFADLITSLSFEEWPETGVLKCFPGQVYLGQAESNIIHHVELPELLKTMAVHQFYLAGLTLRFIGDSFEAGLEWNLFYHEKTRKLRNSV